MQLHDPTPADLAQLISTKHILTEPRNETAVSQKQAFPKTPMSLAIITTLP